MISESVLPYVVLIRHALNNEISLEEFTLQYMDRFSNETNQFGGDLYEIINGVFLAADEYCPSESPLLEGLRKEHPEFVIEDNELIEGLRIALSKLEE
jgi:hypothetical protein